MSVRRCPNSVVANGFELKSEGRQGDDDDTAANNVRLYCGQADPPYVEGDGQTWGDWTGAQKCDDGYAICGIQAQIEPPQGRGIIYQLKLSH